MVLLEVIMTILIMRSLSICSFNCRGYNSIKKDFVRKLLPSVDILLLQEHWLSDCQLSILGDIDSTFVFTGVSGFENKEVLKGRPYGGCAILWRAALNVSVQIIPTGAGRISAVKLTSDKFRLLLINVYMTCDDGSHLHVNEYADVLLKIDQLIVNNFDCHCVIGGDYNVDFSRNSVNTALLRGFCDNHGFKCASNYSDANIDYTYHFGMTRFSVIDEFILSDFLFHNMLRNVRVIHDIDNLSDHEPLVIELHLPIQHAVMYPNISRTVDLKRVAWFRATSSHVDDYRNILRSKISSVFLPLDSLTCYNRNCSNIAHRNSIAQYCNDITHSCTEAGLLAIPRVKPGVKRIPGFTEHVQPFRDKSLLWHEIWTECGRPRTGHVADCMRRARAAYHYAIRRVKRHADDITRDRFADALMCDNTRNFWTEVKKIRTCKMSCANIVDGCSDANDIVNIFNDKYRDLYTSVSYDQDDANAIMNSIENNIDCDSACEFIISPVDIRTCVSYLKRGKNDVNMLLTSDHFIDASNELYVHLALLFSAMLMHGFVPNSFLASSVRPIPKGHNLSTADSSNYRGIAISSILNKIFDNVVMVKYQHLLSTSDLQFGFKKNHSTHMCTMVFKETVSYYLSNKSNVFCTFLDATKAFDRIHYCKLFRLLIHRSIPYCVIRILLYLYLNNCICVSWSGVNSESFIASNGVKQGGVLSPVLFCIYMDELLARLSRAGFGCYIGGTFVGALAYADDVVLIAPTPYAMRGMLCICDQFSVDYDVSFNASKSKCMYFHSRRDNTCSLFKYSCDNITFTINGYVMEFVKSYKHLGHIINCDLNDNDDIAEKRISFICQTNNLLCYFSKLSSSVKYRLFTYFCNSYFGCELWRTDNDNIESLCAAWRRALRRIWALPYDAHSFILPILCNCLPLIDVICKRIINFSCRCLSDDSSLLVRTIVFHALVYGRSLSPLGISLMSCCRRYCCSISDLLANRFCVSRSTSTEDQLICDLLKELIGLRDGFLVFSSCDQFLHRDELSDLIKYICTM